jgi:hypothetical protein
MRKSVIEPAEQLRIELYKLSNLVDKFQAQEPGITDLWLTWIRELEDLLKKYGYRETAEITGHRASILSNANRVDKQKRKLSRKKRLAALATVQPIQQLLSDKCMELEDKIDAVRIMIKQILLPAKDAGMFTYDPKTDFSSYLESLLTQFKSHEQLAPGINNAIASIGKYDVLKIIAEEIEF